MNPKHVTPYSTIDFPYPDEEPKSNPFQTNSFHNNKHRFSNLLNSYSSPSPLQLLIRSEQLVSRTVSSFSNGLKESEPIFIEGNDDLIDQASAKGWLGDGTFTNPIMISGVMVKEIEITGIKIINTDLHFIISNCFFKDQQQ